MAEDRFFIQTKEHPGMKTLRKCSKYLHNSKTDAIFAINRRKM